MESPYQWFAMRATYKRELKAKDYLQNKGIKVFVPLKKIIKVVGGVKRTVVVPAINSLIFVKAQKEVLQSVKTGVQYLQYITRRVDGKNVPVIVPERQMEEFILIAQDDAVVKTYLTPKEVDLKEGTRVRIHGGVFDGMEGILLKIKGNRKRYFHIVIDDIVAVRTIVENIDLIEVI